MILLTSCGNKKIKVDSIYHNGRIVTMNDSLPEASILVIDKGKIINVGGDELLTRYTCNDTAFIDLKKRYVYPGLIDAHCHFYGYAKTLLSCDLTGTKSWSEVTMRVKDFSNKDTGYWIMGRGWDQYDWPKEIQTFNNSILNEMFPNRPVILKRVDGHAAICNQKALELAGINIETKIEGGEILRNEDNTLSGLLIDNAVELVEKIIPSPSKDRLIQSLKYAENDCYSRGLTCLADAGLDINECLFLDSLHDKGDLSIYMYMMLNPNTKNMEYAKNIGIYESDNSKICSFKLYADGSLGSRGALLKKDYCDRAGHRGLSIHNRRYLDSFAKMTLAITKYQLNTHCIGDSANKMMLDIFSQILPIGNDLRWRIEHAQIVDPADMVLFGRYGIIPSVQPTHACSDAPWVLERICENRIKGAYAYKSLLANSGYIALGTDFPVEKINPLHTFYAAIFRKSIENEASNPFQIEEKLSALEALKGMTTWAAKSCFLDHRKGQIKKGYDADFVIIDTNLLTAEESSLRKAKILYT
ncbi:MAG: amidohydrolase, partial [Bacteroidia bacterium]|nr:amidohydrolase [Bacteroidia bacterium]